MKIAFVSTMNYYSWGGSEEYWHELAKEALFLGNEVVISVSDKKIEHPKIQDLLEKGVKIIFRRSKLNPIVRRIMPNYSNFKNHLEIARFKPDIVIVSQGGSYEILNDIIFSEWLIAGEIPYIIITHGNNESLVLSDDKRILGCKLFKSAKYVLFPALWALSLAQRQLLTSLSNFKIFSNPVLKSEGIVKCDNDTKGSGTIRMAMVGSLTLEWKGHDIILEILAQSKWQKRDFILNIFGEGKDRNYINKLISYYGLNKRVTLKGRTNNVTNVWSSHHLHLLPSRVEAAPIALVEAMLLGVPNVTTNVGGISEWITPITGYLAKAPNAAEYDMALEISIEDRNNWWIIAKNAEQHAKSLLKERYLSLEDLLL